MSSHAVIDSAGLVRRLDRLPDSDERTTASDVQDPEKLARLVQDLRKRVTILERRHAPRWRDFEDVTVSTAGATVQLEHRFGTRVRFHVVDWTSATGAPDLRKDTTNTDADTLVLASYVAGTATVRVEEAG
jgi:hypothetical protein